MKSLMNADMDESGTCLVPGCDVNLASCPQYYRRHRVCLDHVKASVVTMDGDDFRFCQQCARFQPLAEFKDNRRSCRAALQAHNSRRKECSEMATYLYINDTASTMRTRRGTLLEAGSSDRPARRPALHRSSSADSTLSSGASAMQAARGRPGRKSRLAAAASHTAQAGDSSQGTCTDDQRDQELPSESPSASDVSAAAVVELGPEKQQPEQPGAQIPQRDSEELPHTQAQDQSTTTDEQQEQQAAGEAHQSTTRPAVPRKRPAAAAAGLTTQPKQLQPQGKRGRKPRQAMPAQRLPTDAGPALDAAAHDCRWAKGPRRAAASKLPDRQMSSSSSRLHPWAFQESSQYSDPTAATQGPGAAVWTDREMFCCYPGFPGDMSFLERCCTPEQLLWLQQQAWMAQQWLLQQQQEAPLATGSSTWQQAQGQNTLPPAVTGHQLLPEGAATMPQQQPMWSSYAQPAPELSQQDWSAAEQQQGVQQRSASAGRSAISSALLTAMKSMQGQQVLQRGNGTAAGAAAGPYLEQQQQDAACTSSGRLPSSAEQQYAADMAAGQHMRASEHRPVHNSQLQGAILAGSPAFQQQGSSRQQQPRCTDSTPSESARDMEQEGIETWHMFPGQDTSIAYGIGDVSTRYSFMHGQDMHTGDPSPAGYTLQQPHAMAATATAQLQRQVGAVGAAASISSPAAAAAMLPMLPEVAAAGPGPGHPPGLAGAVTTTAAARWPQQALGTMDLQPLPSCHSVEMEWLEAFDLSAAGDIPSEEVEELLDSFE